MNAREIIQLERFDWAMDAIAELVRNAETRDSKMQAAHARGLQWCELCGESLATGTSALRVDFDSGEAAIHFGQACASRFKQGLANCKLDSDTATVTFNVVPEPGPEPRKPAAPAQTGRRNYG